MKLLKQIIQKQMELYEEFKLKRYYKRSFWKFYCALNLSLVFLRKKLNRFEEKRINSLFKKIISKDNITENKFKKIEKYLNSDIHYVIECLEILDNVQNERYQMGDIYVEGMIGVSSYEYEI